MNTFCPFFRDNCRGNECIMFRDGDCLVVKFFQSVSEEHPERGEIVETTRFEIEEEAEVPDWLNNFTAEEIASEILEFKKERFPEEEYIHIHTAITLFWEEKGIQRYRMPSEISIKISQADTLASIMYRKEQQNQKKIRMEKENTELPSLVGRCVDWARTNNLKRVTVADIDAYILENELDILNETKRAIYAKTNVDLKANK